LAPIGTVEELKVFLEGLLARELFREVDECQLCIVLVVVECLF
jgi:hypothetical protein